MSSSSAVGAGLELGVALAAKVAATAAERRSVFGVGTTDVVGLQAAKRNKPSKAVMNFLFFIAHYYKGYIKRNFQPDPKGLILYNRELVNL